MAVAGAWSSIPGVKLAPELISALSDSLGFPKMTAVQRNAIPPLLSSKDVCADAETGSGKTLAFLIPIAQTLVFEPGLAPKRSPHTRALVILPTRELARQVHSVAKTLFDALPGNVSPYAVVGGEAADSQALAKAKDLRVVIATPGRLNAELVAGNLRVADLEILILDEADRLLDMGFDVTLTDILSRLPKQRRTGLYSATQSEEVESLARAGLRNPVRVKIQVKSAANSNTVRQRTPLSLSAHYIIVRQQDKLAALCRLLAKKKSDKFIVYFLTCASVQFHFMLPLNKLLKRQGGDSEKRPFFMLHGKMMQSKRSRNLKLFSESQNGVLFCTDVAARGIDLPDVDAVVQFDIPQDPDVYVHRVGRTARLGRDGYSLIMLTPEEEAYVEFLNLRNCPLAPLRDADSSVIGMNYSAMEMFEVDLDKDEAQPALTPIRSDVDRTVRETIMGNRAILDASEKAFLSYIRGYKEHKCMYILKLENLDINAVVHSFHLLRIPKFHEFKKLKKKLNFVKDETVRVRDIAYINKEQEEKRRRTIREAEESRKKGSKKRNREVDSKSAKKNWKKKMAAAEDEDSEEDFGHAASLLKKAKRGRMAQDEVDQILDEEEDEQLQKAKSKRKKSKKKR